MGDLPSASAWGQANRHLPCFPKRRPRGRSGETFGKTVLNVIGLEGGGDGRGLVAGWRSTHVIVGVHLHPRSRGWHGVLPVLPVQPGVLRQPVVRLGLGMQTHLQQVHAFFPISLGLQAPFVGVDAVPQLDSGVKVLLVHVHGGHPRSRLSPSRQDEAVEGFQLVCDGLVEVLVAAGMHYQRLKLLLDLFVRLSGRIPELKGG